MDDLEGTNVDAPEVETPDVGAEGSGPEVDAGGINPAWEPLRSKLDPVSFKLIEDDLRNWDKSAETRISTLNQTLSEYKKLGEPEALRQYATIAQRIESEPETIYQALGEFLRQTGRMPTDKELADKVDEIEDDEDQDENPELRELREGQEQMRQFLLQQEQERLAKEADAALDSEVKAVREAHPELEDADMRNILMRAALLAQQSRKNVSIDEIAKEYIEDTRNRILSTKRPGENAPNLVPSSGAGVPLGAEGKSVGKLSRTETQDLVAEFLNKNRP